MTINNENITNTPQEQYNSDIEYDDDVIPIPSVILKKKILEQIINSEIPTNEWNTFACLTNGLTKPNIDLNNPMIEDLFNECHTTGVWLNHDLGNIFAFAYPSFDELKPFLEKYNIILTDSMFNEWRIMYNNEDSDDCDTESESSDEE
jgi:hypothetical protein